MRDDRKSADFFIGIGACILIYALAALAVIVLSEHTTAGPYVMSLVEVIQRWTS